MKITTAWRDRIAESRFDDDPAQLAVVRELQELQDWLEEQRGFVERVRHLFTPSIRAAQRRGSGSYVTVRAAPSITSRSHAGTRPSSSPACRC